MSAAFAQRIAVRSTYKSEAVGLVCKFNIIHCHGHRLRQIELFLRIFLYLQSKQPYVIITYPELMPIILATIRIYEHAFRSGPNVSLNRVKKRFPLYFVVPKLRLAAICRYIYIIQQDPHPLLKVITVGHTTLGHDIDNLRPAVSITITSPISVH